MPLKLSAPLIPPVFVGTTIQLNTPLFPFPLKSLSIVTPPESEVVSISQYPTKLLSRLFKAISFFNTYPVLEEARFVVDPLVTKATFGENIPPLPAVAGTEPEMTIKEGREGSEI